MGGDSSSFKVEANHLNRFYFLPAALHKIKQELLINNLWIVTKEELERGYLTDVYIICLPCETPLDTPEPRALVWDLGSNDPVDHGVWYQWQAQLVAHFTRNEVLDIEASLGLKDAIPEEGLGEGKPLNWLAKYARARSGVWWAALMKQNARMMNEQRKFDTLALPRMSFTH